MILCWLQNAGMESKDPDDTLLATECRNGEQRPRWYFVGYRMQEWRAKTQMILCWLQNVGMESKDPDDTLLATECRNGEQRPRWYFVGYRMWEWRAKSQMILCWLQNVGMDSKDPYNTMPMHRMIWICAFCTCSKACFWCSLYKTLPVLFVS